MGGSLSTMIPIVTQSPSTLLPIVLATKRGRRIILRPLIRPFITSLDTTGFLQEEVFICINTIVKIIADILYSDPRVALSVDSIR